MTRLLSHSVKTDKGVKTHGIGTAVMYLAPAWLSGKNTCAMHTKECAAVCLHDSGMLGFRQAQAAQLARTEIFWTARADFLAMLEREIATHVKQCARLGLKPAVRLNGTSDIRWERIAPDLLETFSAIPFYDYTKLPNRRDLPPNYTLTYSLSETELSWSHHLRALEEMNTAVVLAGCGSSRYPKPFPKTWNGRRVIDGDLHDVRYLDRPSHGAYVALRPKGKATKVTVGGFVKDAWTSYI